MPSTKGGGPTSPQLRLPSAPTLDRYGLHSYECECARCGLGFRPTAQERETVRRHFERREAIRKAAEAKAANETKEEVRSATTWERLKAQERETTDRIDRMTRPVERPATAEELAELKKLHGFKRRNAK